MAINVSASNTEEYVEERLIVGLLTGSLLQHKELLDVLEDVDVRYKRQKTLLHVGVGLGKADWVEELLARGADPQLMDDNQMDALSSAEEMVRRFPEDLDHSEVLKLMKLVHRRDQVIKGRLESSSSRGTAVTTPVAIPDLQIASLKSSVDALRQEMRSLVSQLSSSLEELKANVCGRDTLLRCLEEAVTSTAEDVTSIKNGLGGGAVVRPLSSDPVIARQEYVDAMLRRTEIVYGDGVELMRRFYESLYDEDNFTACIIKYLSGDYRVKVLVDCDWWHVRRMQGRVVDLHGFLQHGNCWRSFCDLEREIVYFAAKVFSDCEEKKACAELAWALSQLSLKLVFGYAGWSYELSDAKRKCEWMKAIQEMEKKRRGELDWFINNALHRTTQWAKECLLAAAVPRIVSEFGSTTGRAKLREQAPLLLSFYSNHVMSTLLAKGRR